MAVLGPLSRFSLLSTMDLDLNDINSGSQMVGERQGGDMDLIAARSPRVAESCERPEKSVGAGSYLERVTAPPIDIIDLDNVK